MTANFYSGGALDRAGLLRRDADELRRLFADSNSRLVPVWRSQNLIDRQGEMPRAALPTISGAPWLAKLRLEPLFLGLLNGTAYFAVDLSAIDEPAELVRGEFVDLRSVGALLSGDEAGLLSFARGLIHWHQGHGYCGRCGAPTESRDGGHRRCCSNAECRLDHFPRTDPAIIVLVSAGDRALLGRQARWPEGMFSTLAGFVEPGESLEEAVAREVMEETGVSIARLRYHSSQPWPFPSSLMLGFFAEAENAMDVTVDTHELEAASWFSRDDILRFAEQGRSLPRPDSIARRLITDWLG